VKLDVVLTAASSLAALVIAIVALVYTIRAYLLKAGLKLRCSYSIQSTVECEDSFVQTMTIENLKDKSVVIFKIYLRIEPNYFVEIESFEEAPMILKPFEIYQKSYDPIVYYDLNTKRIKLNNLLSDRAVKKTVILSTSSGKYEVTGNIKKWDAIVDFFNNYFTALIRPMRLFHKEKGYGSNVNYLLEIKGTDGSEQVIAIQNTDYQVKKFVNFQLTKESLADSSALEGFLEEQMRVGKLKCESFRVIDFTEELKAAYRWPDVSTVELERLSKLKYRFIGRFLTIVDKAKERKLNRKPKAQQRKV
jgi:hypothetical protein